MYNNVYIFVKKLVVTPSAKNATNHVKIIPFIIVLALPVVVWFERSILVQAQVTCLIICQLS